MTRIISDQVTADGMPDQRVGEAQIQSVEIVDPVYEEPYTANITKKSNGWRGWIPDIPEVKCEAKTRSQLLETLVTKLREALESREEAWDQQLEADIKSGKLERLREEALEDIKAGRVIDL
jgi:predicted RNase H-like HicB family nuclease